MPTYRYEAMTSSGNEEVNFVEASDKQSAQQLLRGRGLFVTKLAESAEGSERSVASGQDQAESTFMLSERKSSGMLSLTSVIVFLAIGGLVCIGIAGFLTWKR